MPVNQGERERRCREEIVITPLLHPYLAGKVTLPMLEIGEMAISATIGLVGLGPRL